MKTICGMKVLFKDAEMDFCNCDECRCKIADIIARGKIENERDVVKDATRPDTEITVVSKCPRNDEFVFHIHKRSNDIIIDICDEENNVRTYIQKDKDYYDDLKKKHDA